MHQRKIRWMLYDSRVIFELPPQRITSIIRRAISIRADLTPVHRRSFIPEPPVGRESEVM